jgi:hypothetical protein
LIALITDEYCNIEDITLLRLNRDVIGHSCFQLQSASKRAAPWLRHAAMSSDIFAARDYADAEGHAIFSLKRWISQDSFDDAADDADTYARPAAISADSH